MNEALETPVDINSFYSTKLIILAEPQDQEDEHYRNAFRKQRN
jgi:hypothetical protein